MEHEQTPTLEQEFLSMLEELNIDDFIDENGEYHLEEFSIKCETLY